MNNNFYCPYNQFDSSNSIVEMLNKGAFTSPAMVDFYWSQCAMNIQNNIHLIGILENLKVNMNQVQMEQEMSLMNPVANFGINTPKAGNIFAPKPLHATKKSEFTRIGRSHSMYVSEPVKPEISTGDKSNGSDKNSEAGSQNSEKKQISDTNNARKRMNVFRCPHTDRKHYAKNMCNNCYHKQGRNKKATKCPHKDRQNYAKGKCQNCYLNDYHKVKRRMKKQQLTKVDKVSEEIDRRISVETATTEMNQPSTQIEN
jgi:hypothetical protein